MYICGPTHQVGDFLQLGISYCITRMIFTQCNRSTERPRPPSPFTFISERTLPSRFLKNPAKSGTKDISVADTVDTVSRACELNSHGNVALHPGKRRQAPTTTTSTAGSQQQQRPLQSRTNKHYWLLCGFWCVRISRHSR